MAIGRDLFHWIILFWSLPVLCVKNVLFIIVDDLRPEVTQAYSQSNMLTPNIDRLASISMVFDRAYCQQAICGPTRNSFLSGRRPQRTESWNFIDHFREVGSNWVAFPEYFKNHNYTTLGAGKTYHPGLPPNWDEPKSWSQDRPYIFKGNAYKKCTKLSPPQPNSLVCVDPDPDLSHFSDYANLQGTLDNLKYVVTNTSDKPFFLAYGIHRPHLPWHVPKAYWDKYPDTDKIPLPKHQSAPKDMPPIAFTYECDGMSQVPVFGKEYPVPGAASPHIIDESAKIEANATKAMRKGYYAAVSWADFLIGQLLDALEGYDLMEDTVIALVGDHGWQLGEHNIWGKHTNFELGTRVPLIIHAPGIKPNHTRALVESVDIYPTVAVLAGLPLPPDVDGTDLTPLFLNPSIEIKEAAFSEYPRCPSNVKEPWTDTTSCIRTDRHKFTVMGYSVRTDEWRYTVWLPWDGVRLQGNFDSSPVGVELYSHEGDTDFDFDKFENENLANQAQYAPVLKQMYMIAVKHWNKTSISPSPPLLNNALERQWSKRNLDNCLCATQNCINGKNPDKNYTVVTTEGYMPTEYAEGTVLLYQYWDTKNMDNLVTTAVIPPEGFVSPIKLNPAGRIFKKKPEGVEDVAALQIWYHENHHDYLTCALPATIIWAKQNNYSLVDPEIGYVFTHYQKKNA